MCSNYFQAFYKFHYRVGIRHKQISVDDTSIWGVNSHDHIYEMTNINFDDDGQITNPAWTRIDGGLSYVSVHGGVIWGVSSDHRIWFKSNSSAPWESIPGALKQIEIGAMGVFGVNGNDQIYYRVGTHNNPNSSGSAWQHIPGGLKHISSGKSTVWGVNSSDDIYKMINISFDADGNIQFQWQHFSGKLKNISTF